MSRRRQNAALQAESVDNENADARGAAASPSVEPAERGEKRKDGFLRTTMVLWGFPLALFIVIAVLKQCEMI